MTAPPVLRARRLRDGRRMALLWCARCGDTRWRPAGDPTGCRYCPPTSSTTNQPHDTTDEGQRTMAEIKELLRTAMICVLNPPPELGRLQVFWAEIHNVAGRVIDQTADDSTEDGRAWHRAAVATRAILRDHGEDVKTEWLAAFAELPPMPFPSSYTGIS